ncbi:MAG TPA: HlyC/CorC family transporter [Rhodospirillales bacterium]|nr:HlyC/CorC family transporter [Rhodospirillales bacterium]
MNDPLDKPVSRPEPALASKISGWLRRLIGHGNGDDSASNVLAELIEERDDAETPIDDEERILLANILELKGRTIHDVMVPLADIVGVESATSLPDLISMITKEGHSRMPVYDETLDGVIGMIHIKDVLAWRGLDDRFKLKDIVRTVLFVPPSMQVLELLMEMRVKRCHMALVVDEYGGVDGLVTIEDLVEEIVGEIEDEHDHTDEPMMSETGEGVLLADARVTLEVLEDRFGSLVSGEERDRIDTLGGLVFTLAGRVPVRGELISHPSGLEIEVLDADPRRVKKLRIRGLVPSAPTDH